MKKKGQYSRNKDIRIKKEKITRKEQKTDTDNTNRGNNLISFKVGVTLVYFIIALFFIPDTFDLIKLGLSKTIFYLLLIITSVTLYFISNSRRAATLSKYLFAILLIGYISYGILPRNEDAAFNYLIFLDRLNKIIFFLLPFTSFVGVISIYYNKEKLHTHTYTISAKTKLFYNLIFIFIVFLSIYTMFFKLDKFDLYSDESQVTNVAAGYYYTGEYKAWDFVKDQTSGKRYNRALPHIWLVSKSFEIFGITPWAARFPSAFFGVIMIIAGYFVSLYFTKNHIASLLIIFSFAFYFQYLQLFRWARMYAVVIPLNLIAFWLTIKMLNEENSIKLLNKSKLINKYFNFNFKYLPLLIMLYYLDFKLHFNTLLLFPAIYLYVIIKTFIKKEKKIIILSVLGFVFAILGYLFIPNVASSIGERIEFLKVNNYEVYTSLFWNYPYYYLTGFILVIISIAFIINKKEYIDIYLPLIIITVFTWFLFSYGIKYSISFRYMSMFAAMGIILFISTLINYSNFLLNKYFTIFFVLLTLTAVFSQYTRKYKDLYIKNYAAPIDLKTAWHEIETNAQAGDLLLRHWGATYYLDSVNNKVIERYLRKGDSAFIKTLDTIRKYKKGWITWSYHNSYAVDSTLITYIERYFQKIHGTGIDQTNVEVYKFDSLMIADTAEFYNIMNLPIANINLNNPISISFDIQVNSNKFQKPFLIYNKDTSILNIEINDKQIIVYYTNNQKLSAKINTESIVNVVLYQKKNIFGIKINGVKADEKKLDIKNIPFCKIAVNPYFNGYLDNVRIYDYILSDKQIASIIENRYKDSKKLIAGNQTFDALFYWKKKM